VTSLGPAAFRLLKRLEPGDAGHAHEFLNTIARQHNVDVLRHPADKAMPPDRPASCHNGWTLQDVQQVINRLHDTTIATRQVLWRKHGAPPCAQSICKVQSVREIFQ
jgi:hypothetical protein